MFKKITANTTIRKGDLIRHKETGEEYMVGSLQPDGKFEIRPGGRDTLLRDGILLVADVLTLMNKFDIYQEH